MPKRAVNIYKTQGNCYTQLRDRRQALAHYHQALLLAESLGDSTLVSPVVYNIGRVHLSENEFDKAIQLFYRALAIDTYLQDSIGMGYDYNQIGLVYQKIGHLDQSDSLLRLSLSIRRKLQHTAGIAYTNMNLVNIMIERHAYDSALVYLYEAKENLEAVGDWYSHADVIKGIGNAYWWKGDLETCKQYYRQAMALHTEMKDWERLIDTQADLAMVETQQNHLKEGERLALEALSLAEMHGIESVELYKTLYDRLFRNARKQGNYQAAFEYLEEYHTYYIKLQEIQAKEKIANLETEYELLQKGAELEAVLQQQKIRGEQQQLIQLISGVLIAVLLLFLVALLYFYSQRNKSIALLRQQKQKIEEQQLLLENHNEEISSVNELLSAMVKDRTEELEKYAKHLEQRNAQLEHYAFMNSHKVRGPLARILGLFELLSLHAYTSEAEKKEILLKVKQEAHALDEVIKAINQELT